MTWFTVHHEDNTAFAHIGDDLGCNGQTAADFLAALDDAPRVELHIDSHGGCSRTALEIVDGIRGRVCVATIGRALSSAAIIAQGCRHRQVYTDGRVMLHPSTDFVCGNARELRQTADRLDGIRRRQIELLRMSTGQDGATVAEWMTSGPDFWFTASEAIGAGLVDSIIPRPPTLAQRMKGRGLPAPPQANETERLFFDMLSAFPRIEATDRAAFGQRLQSWFAASVR